MMTHQTVIFALIYSHGVWKEAEIQINEVKQRTLRTVPEESDGNLGIGIKIVFGKEQLSLK